MKASEEFAKKLQEEEKQIEDKLKEDEDIARQLQRKELEQVSDALGAIHQLNMIVFCCITSGHFSNWQLEIWYMVAFQKKMAALSSH